MIKRIISASLAIIFVLTMGTSVVFASQKEKRGDFIPPGIAKKAFEDLDKFPWALKAIEKMRLKGLVRGKEEKKFAPQSSVTKLETIIMALRIMGWEDETAIKTTLPREYKGKEIGEWAKGYVAVAFEKGLLDEVDMMYFNPNEPAKRHEVAKYVIRALDYEDEAKEHMNDELDFKDAPAIPQGSVGYIYLVNKMNLMVGDDGKFNPMGTLTRAEMAVLFDRLDEKVENDVDEYEYVGEIHKISSDEITLKIDDELKTFDISDDVVVYDNDNQIRYSKLNVGYFVSIQIEDNEVSFIEIIDENSREDKLITKYTGVVTDITEGTPINLTVQIKRMQIIFEVNDDVLVYFNNEKGNLDEIENGDAVTVTVDTKNRAREIRCSRESKESTISKIKGTITEIDLDGTYNLFINKRSHRLSKDAKVNITGQTNPKLEDLEVGYEVICELEDNIIINIEVLNIFTKLSGKIDEIGTRSITLIVNGESMLYKLSEDLVVTIDGQKSSYGRLEKEMAIEVKIKNDLVYQIDAEIINE